MNDLVLTIPAERDFLERHLALWSARADAPMPLVTGRGALGFFAPDRDVLPAIEAALLSRVAG